MSDPRRERDGVHFGREETTMAMGVTATPKCERFFRSAAEVDVHKNDQNRLRGFVFERSSYTLFELLL